MTCRHEKGDPNCSSSAAYVQRQYAAKTPDSSRFEVVDVEQVGRLLVLKVKYPNCSSCAYEGTKVMVFENATLKDAIKWRKIDPHFRDPKLKAMTTDAPAPIARFPGTDVGWQDALNYASSKGITEFPRPR